MEHKKQSAKIIKGVNMDLDGFFMILAFIAIAHFVGLL